MSPLALTPQPDPRPSRIWLYLILWIAWLAPGLVGHDPWKPDEAYIFGVVHEMGETGDWIVPRLAGEPFLENPPFYYMVAAFFANLFAPWLEPHDGARLASGLFMGLTLLFLGFAGRELYGRSYGWVAAMALVGCVGLLVRAHQIITEVAALSGLAAAFYGMALALRRPYTAGPLIGTGAGVAFLANGAVPLAIAITTALVLPVLFAAWRTRAYLLALLFGGLLLTPWIAIWPYALYQHSSALFERWLWHYALGELLGGAAETNRWYYLGILPWYAWPVLPMALWVLWYEGRPGLSKPGIQLPLTAFAVTLGLLSAAAELQELRALPLLLPLSLLAAASVDSLKRGAAAALDWFGIMTFGVFAALMWVGWIALVTGRPAAIVRELADIQPELPANFGWGAFALSLLTSLLWLALVSRIGRSNRRALINWAGGITLIWILAMSLWLPFIETTKSYRATFVSLRHAIPQHYDCIASRGLGDSQRALLKYFSGIVTRRLETQPAAECILVLVQGRAAQPAPLPPGKWKAIWEGSRPGDKTERYRLFERERSQ